jgi:ribose transport system permease protein
MNEPAPVPSEQIKTGEATTGLQTRAAPPKKDTPPLPPPSVRNFLAVFASGPAKKLAGIALFLLILYVILLVALPNNASAWNENHYNLGKRIGLYGIISLGAGLLIITGGIDLSIGSVVALSSAALAVLLIDYRWSPPLAMLAVLGLGVVVGLANGLLVTKVKVQPFVTTLCGLFIYRGIARWLTGGKQKGLKSEFIDWKEMLALENFHGLPKALLIFAAVALIVGVMLHFTTYGRYFYAVGSNERAARYAGIPTSRYKLAAYVICSTLAALFGILNLMAENSVQPSQTGQFFELYAIAGAVLGGCSLRGGEGSVAGIVIGTSIVWLLPNLANMWGISSEWEAIVIGTALLLGAILDETIRRRQAVRAGD